MSEENLFPLEEFVQRIAPRLPSKEQQARLQDLLDRAATPKPGSTWTMPSWTFPRRLRTG